VLAQGGDPLEPPLAWAGASPGGRPLEPPLARPVLARGADDKTNTPVEIPRPDGGTCHHQNGRVLVSRHYFAVLARGRTPEPPVAGGTRDLAADAQP